MNLEEQNNKLRQYNNLRSFGITLSEEDVIWMLKSNQFFDTQRNIRAAGIDNKFKRLLGDSLVYDKATELFWQHSVSPHQMIFEEAGQYVQNFNRRTFAGYSDWRLPTLEEAMSLMEPEKSSNHYYINTIFGRASWIWMSDKASTSRAWVVGFNVGHCSDWDVNSQGAYVLAVRKATHEKNKQLEMNGDNS